MRTFDDALLEDALRLYHFDRDSGCFFKIIQDVNNQPVITGKFAGTTTPTGIRLTVRTRHLMAHHLAWRLFEGEWPIANVKHLDGDVTNCKAANLYSPQAVKVKYKRKSQELDKQAAFFKSIGITNETRTRALLDQVRADKGERAYIEHLHLLRRITDDQKIEMLRELRVNP